MPEYRVECNFGSRYFANAADAIAFFKRKQAKNLDAEIWIVDYRYAEKIGRYTAKQELLDYFSPKAKR